MLYVLACLVYVLTADRLQFDAHDRICIYTHLKIK